jgi:hypothetical protein
MRNLLSLICLLSTGCSAYTYETITERLDATSLQLLRFETASGDLDIQGDPDATEIVVHATASGFLADPCPVMDSLRLELYAEDSTGWLRVSLDDADLGWVDVEVTLPSSMIVDGDDNSGDIRIDDVAGLVLSDGSGDVRIGDVAGAVWLSDGSGDIVIDDIGGDVDIIDGSGDIVLDGAADVRIEDGSGDIFVDDVDSVTIWDGSGDIVVRDAGSVDIVEDGSGDLVLR